MPVVPRESPRRAFAALEATVAVGRTNPASVSTSIARYTSGRRIVQTFPISPSGDIERAWDVLGPVPAAPGMHATTSCPES
jgi:hypothetical protein